MTIEPPPIPWLEPGQPFPPFCDAWGENSPAPGLLCAGSDLKVDTLKQAYSSGIFPWYGEGQPILWWCPEPRMVLDVQNFRIHPSLKKAIKQFMRSQRCEIRMDFAFDEVMRACSASPRVGQSGTWILPEMMDAYSNLHRAGFAHSVETWIDGHLAGGLYGVSIGRAVFGESMFHNVSNASKIALAALVAFCRQHKISQIDCQQNTRHLASLGAGEVSRSEFVNRVKILTPAPAIDWQFVPVYWNNLVASTGPNT